MLFEYINEINMKTNLVEIFQTIRASLQPYAVLGFTNRSNTEEIYDLWSDKNIKQGSEVQSETFFASIQIKDNHVLMSTGFDKEQLGIPSSTEIKKIDELKLSEIEQHVATVYKKFKEKEWV